MLFFKFYLVKISILTSLLLISIATFNALVDPFIFFNSPLISNFNLLKPEVQTHERMTKAHQVRIQKPEIIILGSSRAETGLNPRHPGFSVPQQKRYNLALNSANIYEILRYLQHAQSIQPLKQVIIGLDFFMFNVYKMNEADFDEKRLAPSNTGWLLDIFQALLTYDGLLASLNTIKQQNATHPSQLFSNGFKDDRYEWDKIQIKGGHRQAAINNEKYSLTMLDGFPFYSISNKKKQSQSLNTFLEIITFCKKNDIDLRLFISPMHARKIQLLHQIGLWPEFENWKKRLVQLIATNALDYPLWDFTDYNEITTESFPAINDKTTQMKWYWESSHYKKETGDLVLGTILNDTPPYSPRLPNFGTKITAQNIEQHLNKLRVESKKFSANHPEIVAEIYKMIIDTTPKREKLFQQHPDLVPLVYFQKPPTNPQSNAVH